MSGVTGAAAFPRLHDRRTELAAVAALSARVYAGSGGVLLITGSPGMGRTALLAHAVRDFDGAAHLVPAPSGKRVPWSGVRALLSAFGSTPAEVRHALRAARGPDGLAKALSRLSSGRRLLLCVDDHHLWDAHSRAALASVWRPGGGLPGVGWIVSFARHHRPPAVRGATVLRLERLDPAGASALLDDLCPVPAAETVRERLLREAAGHPGILAAATRRLSRAQLAGAEPLPSSLTDGRVLSDVYGKLLDSLPVECRRLLALVAVAGDGPPEGLDAGVMRAAGLARGASAGTWPAWDGSDGPGSEGLGVQGPGVDEAAPDGSWWVGAVPDGPRSDMPASEMPASEMPTSEMSAPVPASDTPGSEVPVSDMPGWPDGDGAAFEAWGSDPRGRAVDASAVLAAARAARTSPEALDSLIADGLLRGTRTALRFADPFLRRAVLATTPVAWRRSTRALFTVPQDDAPPPHPRSVPHRQDAPPGRAGRLTEPPRPKRDARPDRATAASRTVPTSRAAGANDGRTGRGRATAAQAFPLLPGLRHRADRFRAPDGVHARTDVVRGRAELARGLTALADGPVADAHQALLLAAALLEAEAPAEAADARLLAMEAAWAAGDPVACLIALGDAEADTEAETGAQAGGSGSGSAPGAAEAGECDGDDSTGTDRDFLDGMRAALAVRLPEARAPLARVVARDGEADDPRILLRAGSAALVLGDMASAARVHGRALAVVRAEHRTALLPRVLEYLAYAELRAGRHARAGAHAREALQASRLTGQRNMAAHQHAVLALVASVTGHPDAVEEHAEKALERARPHGLAQAITLAEWALARADLARGLAAQASARLAQLVGPGPRSGHFALRMLAVPCYVEAAEAAGRTGEARAVAEEFAVWAAGGVDPHAPAQLARCRAVLADPEKPEEAAYWYGEAMRRHDESGSDFERARTLLSYGKWLRRRRRPLEARARLSDALVTFERAAAGIWADQARAELRATGGAVGGPRTPVTADGLTPQQQRIARFAAEGATNREIADRLSISPRTVDHHLRNVFARLGVRSRVELAHVLRRADEETPNP